MSHRISLDPEKRQAWLSYLQGEMTLAEYREEWMTDEERQDEDFWETVDHYCDQLKGT